MPIDGTVRAKTTKDIINDIYLYQEPAKEKVRKDINKRTRDKDRMIRETYSSDDFKLIMTKL